MAEAWNNIGLANYQNADCTRYFDKAIDLGFVSALSNKARVYDFWQRDDEALTLYNRALKLDPDNRIIWKNRDDIDRTHSGIHYRDVGYIGLILTPSPPMLVP